MNPNTELATSLAKLLVPFPPEAVGKLPKPKNKDAPKGNCPECGGYHGLPAVHLDYVGHAAVTARLLTVDPSWTWEPLSLDERGLPAYDNAGGLWIRLTICGVSRLGYGDGPDPKQRIGDAIRNAAMRFGVALDLWSKEDLHCLREEDGIAPEATTHTQPTKTIESAQIDAASELKNYGASIAVYHADYAKKLWGSFSGISERLPCFRAVAAGLAEYSRNLGKERCQEMIEEVLQGHNWPNSSKAELLDAADIFSSTSAKSAPQLVK